jgi:hypothetical protein
VKEGKMFAQQLVYKKGGNYTVCAVSLEDCLKRTKSISERLADQFLAVTIPFVPGEDHRSDGIHLDCSLPKEWHKDLGKDFMRKSHPPENDYVIERSLSSAPPPLMSPSQRARMRNEWQDKIRGWGRINAEPEKIISTPHVEPYDLASQAMHVSLLLICLAGVLCLTSLITDNHTLVTFYLLATGAGVCMAGVSLLVPNRPKH